jgi:zinc protease
MMRASVVLAALVLVSCSPALERPLVPALRYIDEPSARRAPSEDAPFRTTAPVVELQPPLPRSSAQPFVLDNGMRGFVVQRRGFPMIAARLIVDTTAVEVGDVGGRRAGFLSGVFLSPPEGVLQTSAGCGAVGCILSSRGTSGQLGDVLGRIADLATTDEPDAVTTQRLGTLVRDEQQSTRDPGRSFRRISSALLFGNGHRYGQTAPGDPPTLGQLKALRRRVFDPRRATLIVVGDVSTDDVVTEATRRFGAWQGGAPSPEALRDPPSPLSGPRIAAFHVPAMVQVMGTLVARGPAPRDVDFVAFQVLTELLGGTPSSEAFQHVREEMTAAYQVGSWLEGYSEVSVLGLGGSFERGKVIDGMARLLESVRTVREQGPTPETLERAKRAAVARWRRTMATDEGISGILGAGALTGVPVEATLDLPSRIRAVLAADVQAAARRYLTVPLLRVVLVGNSELLVQAPTLGFGVPTQVDGFGRPL